MLISTISSKWSSPETSSLKLRYPFGLMITEGFGKFFGMSKTWAKALSALLLHLVAPVRGSALSEALA